MLVIKIYFSRWQNNFTQDFITLLYVSIKDLKINTKLKENLNIIKLESIHHSVETLSIKIFKILFESVGTKPLSSSFKISSPGK